MTLDVDEDTADEDLKPVSMALHHARAAEVVQSLRARSSVCFGEDCCRADPSAPSGEQEYRMRIAVAEGTGTVGRHVVQVARERGHDVGVLARSEGVDLTSGSGLVKRLEGVDALIDVTSVLTRSATVSRRFYGATTTNLLTAERAAGVSHHIALSIVGSDRAPFGYYAGKALQERLVSTGPVPWTILRATQFHEFAAQIYGQLAFGPLHLVPKMMSQPVAAREVGERLAVLAEGSALGRCPDLAGPEVLRMARMVRAYAVETGGGAHVVELPLPGGFGKALRNGTLLPDRSADLGVQTYAEWLTSRGRAR
jgi:uncharacterized protein YbjT (DUF2867 family)